jgi:hypothetical protein
MNQATQSVAHRYSQLEAEREVFLSRGRKSAELTIPSLLPKAGHTSSSDFPTPFQAVGARGVNNLASKLLLALLPPNSPFFRLSIDEATQALIAQNKRGAMEKGLAKIERTAMQEIETSAMRVPTYEALRQLIVAGNALMYVPPAGGIRVFRLDRFVVKRDAMGNVLEIATKESVSPQMLPQAAKALLTDPNDKGQRNLDLYTYCYLENGFWNMLQEVDGKVVPDSMGKVPVDKCPFIPLRFIRVDGEDYGRGYIEEYFGDLSSLEALSQAIVEGSAAAAKILFLVRPNGTTKMKVLADAPNGAFVQGNKDDVTVLQLEKQADLRIAQETAKSIAERLAFAFLLNTSVQRDAERVTAEEVRYMAQELESALGGVYSILSQELQLPLIANVLSRLEMQGKMPMMPKGTLKPQIITGMEALGRGQDLNKLATFLKFLQPLSPDIIAQELNIGDYIDRLGASLGIDTDGLIKTPEQKMAEQQAAMARQNAAQMQEMMKDVIGKSAPHVVQGMMKQQQGEQ